MLLVAVGLAVTVTITVGAAVTGNHFAHVRGLLEKFVGDAGDFSAVLDHRRMGDADFAARFADAAAFHQQEKDLLLHVGEAGNDAVDDVVGNPFALDFKGDVRESVGRAVAAGFAIDDGGDTLARRAVAVSPDQLRDRP